MKNKKRVSNWYLRYIINSPLLFYLFLGMGALVFLILTLGISLDGMTLLELIFMEAGNG